MAGPPTWLVEWSSLITGFLIVLLTIALVVLYKQQKDLFAENHRGLIDIVNSDFNGDSVNLELSNFGNGVVTDLSLLTLLDFESEEATEFGFVGVRMERQDESAGAYTIQGNEVGVPFQANAKIARLDDEWESRPFSLFLAELSRQDVSNLYCQFVVTGRDLTGDEIREPVDYPFEIDLTQAEGPLTAQNVNQVFPSPAPFDTFDEFLSGPNIRERMSHFLRRLWRGLKDLVIIPSN